ncbi:hypothetical protein DM01DRAFT_1288175 [Hesseltinella vesiculosa]|uniref:CBS domain-containing protein n=1 Tax=Hesseltinella vesiculosa TaxID=101127 RepID=A0A1X2GGM8_9FUNG|nr:hypothetical protein DM01DRAFT_1288175 [Hesseltinella vesiculosa]
MNANRFTSLPIFSHNSANVISIVNLFDILLYLVGKQSTVEKSKLPTSDPIENVLGLDSDRESYRMFKTDRHDKLLDTLRYFANGGHRSLVVNEVDETKDPWLLSQTDIINHIVRDPGCVKSLLDIEASVQASGLLTSRRPISAVSGQQIKTIDVYRKMADEHLSGIPILDDQDRFIGDLCLEDIPAADLEKVQLLNLPAMEFLQARHKNIKPIHRQPNVAQKDTSVHAIMESMIKNDTHRVWIVENNKVVGVVSMSDIIACLCSKYPASLF